MREEEGNQMIFSPSNHLGESIFTSSRLKNSKVLFKDQHLQRLREGIEDYYLGRKLEELEKQKFSEAVDSKLSALKSDAGRVRITISAKKRSELTPKSFDFNDLEVSVEVGDLSSQESEIRCKSFPSPFSEHYPSLKMGSYMPLLRLRLLAQRKGADDAALLDKEGHLLELTTSNIFFYKGNRIFTPKQSVLDGVIKREICELCQVEKLDITPGSAAEFDGAFCTNSVWIARPVQSIDQTKFKNPNQRFVTGMIKKILERGYQ